MDKIPLQYITNLDNKYNTLILKIEENIKNFNTYIYNFVQQNYGKTSKNDNQTCTEETATNDETTTNEETTTNDSYDNTEENALVIFNNIEDLYRNIINKRGEESQPSEIPNDLSGNNLSGNDLSGNDLSGNDLSGNDLSGNDLSGNDLSGNDLSGNDLSGNDLSGNDLSGNDLSGNDLSGNDLSGNDLSGNDLYGNDLSGNDLSGNDLSSNDLSGNDLSGNDLSGNDLSGNDLSGNNIHIENDASGRNEEYIENDASGGNGENQPKTITIKQYEIPELIFPTKKKIIRKYYKKLIVKLHPDKIDSKDTVKFQKYYIECKNAKKLNCVYKFWLLTKKIDIKVKKTANVNQAFIKEINILKAYIESLENSPINKWIHADNPDEKDLMILKYISTFV